MRQQTGPTERSDRGSARASALWRRWVALGALFGLLAVVLGAAGTHVLRGSLEEADLRIFETGVRFQMYHALALLALGLLAQRVRGTLWGVAGWSFAAGVLLFCGSLYALALTGRAWPGALAPVGGLALIVGWASLLLAALGRITSREGDDDVEGD